MSNWWFGKFDLVNMHLFDERVFDLVKGIPCTGVWSVYAFPGGGLLFTNTYYIVSFLAGGWRFGNRHGISRPVSGNRNFFTCLPQALDRMCDVVEVVTDAKSEYNLDLSYCRAIRSSMSLLRRYTRW